jgi:uncharacterized protein (DUF1778 family)
MGVATEPKTRTRTLNLRATPRQLQLIKAAAERQGRSATDFILESACEKAEHALADQTRFVLNTKQWKLFMDALGQPPRVIPQIKKLFAAPPIAKSR